MMKTILSRTVSIALAMLLTVSCLSGCGSKSVNTAEYLGTYSTDVTSLIPFYLPDTTGKKVISNVIDGLIETDRFGAFVPSLAESWEHNDDYSVWTFHLRKDIFRNDIAERLLSASTVDHLIPAVRIIILQGHLRHTFNNSCLIHIIQIISRNKGTRTRSLLVVLLPDKGL